MLNISRRHQEPMQLKLARISHRYAIPRQQHVGDGSLREISDGIEMTERRQGIALQAFYLLKDMIPASKNARNRQLNDVVDIAIASLHDEVETEASLAIRLGIFQSGANCDNSFHV